MSSPSLPSPSPTAAVDIPPASRSSPSAAAPRHHPPTTTTSSLELSILLFYNAATTPKDDSPSQSYRLDSGSFFPAQLPPTCPPPCSPSHLPGPPPPRVAASPPVNVSPLQTLFETRTPTPSSPAGSQPDPAPHPREQQHQLSRRRPDPTLSSSSTSSTVSPTENATAAAATAASPIYHRPASPRRRVSLPSPLPASFSRGRDMVLGASVLPPTRASVGAAVGVACTSAAKATDDLVDHAISVGPPSTGYCMSSSSNLRRSSSSSSSATSLNSSLTSSMVPPSSGVSVSVLPPRWPAMPSAPRRKRPDAAEALAGSYFPPPTTMSTQTTDTGIVISPDDDGKVDGTEPVHIEVLEGTYRVVCRLPGYCLGDITIAHKNDGILTMYADRYDSDAPGPSQVNRALEFPPDADLRASRAQFDGGYLTITIPRSPNTVHLRCRRPSTSSTFSSSSYSSSIGPFSLDASSFCGPGSLPALPMPMPASSAAKAAPIRRRQDSLGASSPMERRNSGFGGVCWRGSSTSSGSGGKGTAGEALSQPMPIGRSRTYPGPEGNTPAFSLGAGAFSIG